MKFNASFICVLDVPPHTHPFASLISPSTLFPAALYELYLLGPLHDALSLFLSKPSTVLDYTIHLIINRILLETLLVLASYLALLVPPH